LKSNSVGATKSSFVGWTSADRASQLADFN
jgi:hypothetical protein